MQSCLLNHPFFEDKRIWFPWAEIAKKELDPISTTGYHLVISSITGNKCCTRIAHGVNVFRQNALIRAQKQNVAEHRLVPFQRNVEAQKRHAHAPRVQGWER